MFKIYSKTDQSVDSSIICMHINLEPDSREETKRLFDALSQGGNVTMPLSNRFWRTYFESFTDKYGVNWMLNYQSVG